MGYTAKVFLRRPYVNLTIDVGQKHLPERPIVGELISFEHQGKTENGIVEEIAGGAALGVIWDHGRQCGRHRGPAPDKR